MTIIEPDCNWTGEAVFRFLAALCLLTLLWAPLGAAASACEAPVADDVCAGALLAGDAGDCGAGNGYPCNAAACAVGVAATPADTDAQAPPPVGRGYPPMAASRLPHAAYYPALRPPAA